MGAQPSNELRTHARIVQHAPSNAHSASSTAPIPTVAPIATREEIVASTDRSTAGGADVGNSARDATTVAAAPSDARTAALRAAVTVPHSPIEQVAQEQQSSFTIDAKVYARKARGQATLEFSRAPDGPARTVDTGPSTDRDSVLRRSAVTRKPLNAAAPLQKFISVGGGRDHLEIREHPGRAS